ARDRSGRSSECRLAIARICYFVRWRSDGLNHRPGILLHPGAESHEESAHGDVAALHRARKSNPVDSQFPHSETQIDGDEPRRRELLQVLHLSDARDICDLHFCFAPLPRANLSAIPAHRGRARHRAVVGGRHSNLIPMKIASLLLAAFTAFPVANAFAAPDDERFQKLANEYIEQTLQSHPEQATELGDHRFDDRLTDYSAEARAKE